MPIGKNYTALERAIFECACAGCESIWITVNDDWAPLIKKRIGDYVYDPIWYYRHYDVNPSDGRKYIPIYFVPHMPKYRGRRDNLGWGILNSSIYAHTALKGLSSFATPDMFYAAFPFGVCDPRVLLKDRKKISSNKKYFLSYKGETIKDGKRIGFTFSYEDVKEINRYLHKEGTGRWKQIGEFVKGDTKAWSERLPAEEQYSARFFDLKKVFDPLKIQNSIIAEIDWHYDISCWEGYKNFMGSEHSLKRPVPLTAGILPPIGVDDD